MLRFKKIFPTLDENYAFLRNIWVSEAMKSFKDFLMWYNNKDVVSTLEAMQKLIEFYHQKEIDKLCLGCTSRNLADICLHKLTDSNFYPSTESDKDLLEKIREGNVGGLSFFYTQSFC